MKILIKVYDCFCRVEVVLVNTLLVALTGLVFVSAVARTVGHPVIWAIDVALFIFAWLVFLGGDVTVRTTNMVNVDTLTRKFPYVVQKSLNIIFTLIIIAFLAVLLRFGMQLTLASTARLFQTLPISYSLVTLAVPFGSGLMIISFCTRLYHTIRTPVSDWGK